MKRASIWASISLLLPCVVVAQAKVGGVEERILALEKQLAGTFEKGDAATFEKLVAKDAIVVTPRGSVVDRARWVAGLRESAGTSDEHKVQVLGNTAIDTHRSTVKGHHYRTTHVWARKAGGWQLVSAHSTAIPGVDAPSEPAGLLDPCDESSFAPEVVQFYGDSPTIMRKLEGRELALSKRRMYVLLIETEASAELAVFERSRKAAEMVKVAHWSGSSSGSLRETLTKAILDNRGIACIGAQSKAMINAAYTPTAMGDIPAPVSGEAAFSHFLKKYGSRYVRASVFLLC